MVLNAVQKSKIKCLTLNLKKTSKTTNKINIKLKYF